MFLGDKTLTVVSQGVTGTDRLGRDTYGETARTDVPGCRLEQEGSEEGSELVAGSWVAYLPPDAAVTARDRVEDGSRAFSVDGNPAPMAIPGFPFLDHLMVHLKEVTSA